MDIETGGVIFALLMLVWALTRCPHAWDLVDKTEIPAPVETLAKTGFTPVSYSTLQLPDLCKKRVILVIRCPKCGTAKVLRES